MIFTPHGLVSAMIAPLAAAMNGRVVLQGVSPLLNKIGQKVFSEDLSLQDDATVAHRPRSRPCDHRGSVDIEGHGAPIAATVRSRVGLAPQAAPVYDGLSGEENLRFFAFLYGLRGRRLGERVAWALEFVGLAERRRARAGTYSGGMKRRLNLAAALVHDPELILLDEPTVGVGPQSRNLILEKIANLRRDGRAIMYTTHYMEEAERLCDRVAIVDHGKIIALDTPARLIASLGAEHVVEFEVTTDLDLALLRGLPSVRDLRHRDGAISLTVGELHRAVPALLDELARQRVELSRLATHHATLEDVSVSLTGRHLREA